LPLAVAELKKVAAVVKVSNVYRNPAIGPGPQADFLNAAVLLRIDHSASELRAQLRAIEQRLGRVRTEDKYAPRTIDLDLVIMDDLVEQSPPLPDPEIGRRAHLAVPLAELDPERRIAGGRLSLKEIADQLRKKAKLTLEPNVGAAVQALLDS